MLKILPIGDQYMNKKNLAAACGLLVSAVVCADDTKFYVGAEAGFNKLGYYSSLKNTLNTNSASLKAKVPSVGLLGGVNFQEHFGVEAGYTFYKKAKMSAPTTNGSVKLGNIHFDVLGYAPVARHLEAVGALGIGRAKIKEVNDVNFNGVSGEKYSKIGLRAGAGFQYNIIDGRLAARAMLGYQQMGAKKGLEFVKNGLSFKVGLMYKI